MKTKNIILLAVAIFACAHARAQLLARPATPPNSTLTSTSLYNQWYKYAIQEESLVKSREAAIAQRDVTIATLNAQLAAASAALPSINVQLTAIAQQQTTAARALIASLVQWQDNSPDEDGFRVERSDDGGATWKLMATPPSNSTAWVDFNSVPGTFQYRVTAFKGAVISAPSNVTVKTQFER